MTDDTMHLFDLVQESDDGDFLKAIAETAPQRIMDADVDNIVGRPVTSAARSGRPTGTATASGHWRPGSGSQPPHLLPRNAQPVCDP